MWTILEFTLLYRKVWCWGRKFCVKFGIFGGGSLLLPFGILGCGSPFCYLLGGGSPFCYPLVLGGDGPYCYTLPLFFFVGGGGVKRSDNFT